VPKTKRVLVLSDSHCGHEVGLTPPNWNPDKATSKMSEYREYLWWQFSEAVKKLKPIDILVANGDLIDGRGERLGGVELIVHDRMDQSEMATDIIQFVGAKKVFITRGTDYHVGYEESWENLVAERLKADRIGDVINLDVNGLMFNFRHHIGGSQTPIGRTTPLAREGVWNELWAQRKGFPRANVIVRSHVHYHAYAGIPDQIMMTTPGLQGYGTRYGERRLSGLIDFGFVYFDVENEREYTWKAEIFAFPIPEPVKA